MDAKTEPRRRVNEPSDLTTERPHPMLSPEEARQGVTSGRVTLVLVVSLMLAVLVMAIVYGVYA